MPTDKNFFFLFCLTIKISVERKLTVTKLINCLELNTHTHLLTYLLTYVHSFTYLLTYTPQHTILTHTKNTIVAARRTTVINAGVVSTPNTLHRYVKQLVIKSGSTTVTQNGKTRVAREMKTARGDELQKSSRKSGIAESAVIRSTLEHGA